MSNQGNDFPGIYRGKIGYLYSSKKMKRGRTCEQSLLCAGVSLILSVMGTVPFVMSAKAPVYLVLLGGSVSGGKKVFLGCEGAEFFWRRTISEQPALYFSYQDTREFRNLSSDQGGMMIRCKSQCKSCLEFIVFLGPYYFLFFTTAHR